MSDKIRLKYYTLFVHPLLSIFIPFWFLLTLVLTMLGGIITHYGHTVFPPMFPVLLLLAGASESLVGNLLYKEKIASILPRLREILFVLLFGAFFILLLNGDLIRKDVNFGRVRFWFPFSLIGIQWFLSLYVHQKLRLRENYLRFFNGKEEKDTKTIYQTHSHESSDSAKALGNLKAFIIGLNIGAFFLLIIVLWGFQIQLRGFSPVILVLFFVGSIIMLATLNTWGELQFIMMNGHQIEIRQRRFRMGLLLVLAVAVCMVMIPVSGKHQLLPSSYLSSLFEWLQSLGQFNSAMDSRPVGSTINSRPMGSEQNAALQQLGGEYEESAISAFLKLAGKVVLVGLGVGVVFFLVLPFFRGNKVEIHPLLWTKTAAKAMAKGLQSFFASLRHAINQGISKQRQRFWERKRTASKRGLGQHSSEVQSVKRAAGRKERRRQGKILKSFFRFTKWGEKKGVPFRTSMGPMEYASRIRPNTPEMAAICVEIAKLFEEVVYSRHGVSENLRTAYFEKIKRIVKE